jgi:hypothetical protein
VIAQLTGNPHFPGAAALIAELTASTNALESDYDGALEARSIAATKTVTLGNTERGFDGVYTRVGSHVEDASQGDEAKIKSAGLDVRAERRPVGELPAVQGLTVSVGDSDGELDLHWDRVKGAASYTIETTEDAAQASGWKQAGIVTRSSHTLTGLVSGHKINVRVAAIGTAGQGPWSDPVAKIVP